MPKSQLRWNAQSYASNGEDANSDSPFHLTMQAEKDLHIVIFVSVTKQNFFQSAMSIVSKVISIYEFRFKRILSTYNNGQNYNLINAFIWISRIMCARKGHKSLAHKDINESCIHKNNLKGWFFLQKSYCITFYSASK